MRILLTVVFVCFLHTAKSQANKNEKYNYILSKFPNCDSINVYVHKADTLIKCFQKVEKVRYKPHTDVMISIVYYDTNGKLKYEAQVGGIAGNKKSDAFKKMEKEMILLTTLRNKR
jgi:hypothetical protein